ncbi:MAG: cytochrome c oxidase accessory protein CcoG [Ignavibacteriaceae bacterium]|nr:cytochrome c oxidase accessory protein CcoG [Ignavibacteriaceae bacterium]
MKENSTEEKKEEVNSESFRDQISTVNKEGERKWVFPKKPSGRFYNARNIVSAILLIILFATPFFKVNGQPFMLFDIVNRNFILFGIPFGPHDFFLFVLAMIATIVFIILFTAVFGRVFCGWACPQTIFMEMVFRKIEYWIEGDFREQKKLKAAPWNGKKIFKKTLKHIVFYAISFIIANIFLSYIISMDELIRIISDPPSQHLQGLIAILIFSAAFYWVFSYFREQVCTMVCPYGRLQGVLLDRDSIVIVYDNIRGEPRGRLKKNEIMEDQGDCIACNLCVDVCPTGIDIRDGIQLECINCTACIDACDNVMDKISKPRGLIRFASINSIEKNTKFRFTPRAIGYTILLTVLTGILTFLLVTRTDFSVNILRTPGLLYQERPGDKVSNIYDLNIVNKTFDEAEILLKLENIDGELSMVGKDLILKPQGIVEAKFLVILSRSDIDKMNTQIVIGVYSGDKLIKKISTSLLAPAKKKEKSETTN